jgi:nicotinamidase-related amidase
METARKVALDCRPEPLEIDLDLVLKTLNIRYCAFISGATNVCVGTTLMDAYSHDHRPILVEDAVFTQCPPVTVEATLWNVENLFGRVTDDKRLLTAFAGCT